MVNISTFKLKKKSCEYENVDILGIKVVVVVSFIINSHKMDFTSFEKLYNLVNKNYKQHSFIKSLV